MRKILFIILFSLLILSCKKTSKTTIDVSSIDINMKLQRFDIDFYTANEKTLPLVKQKYPQLFPHQIDSVWINKIQNKDEQELFKETQKVFSDLSNEQQQLENLFKHIRYYNKNFNPPIIITMLTNIDYDNRILYTGDYLFISLDVYLGTEHLFYGDYPDYIKQNNSKEHIIVDAANSIIEKQMLPNTKRNFVDKMIYEGKKMYLLDLYLPKVSDREKIGYPLEKFNWAVNSEAYIWSFFIEKDLLYSTDSKLNKRFLDVAPFSKFYSGEDNLSPGQIGVWIGWQIVRSYMQNNHVSLQELIRTSEEDIFKKSKYKPKR